MFNSTYLYRLFKPLNNENLITDYDVIVGGTNLTGDLNKGFIVLNPISSVPFSSSFKSILPLKKDDENDLYKIKENSLIKITYQIDIYKVNQANLKSLEVESEAYKIREWLKSYQAEDYMKALNSNILPCYDVISFTNELLNHKFVNRAFFTFEVVTQSLIYESTDYVTKIKTKEINL